MDQKPVVFHIDVNSAFLSWESVYRLSLDPHCLDLRQIPSVVGGDPAKRQGIVLAKSILAKQYGIKTGEPLAHALKKCPDLTVVPSRFEIYSKYSACLCQLLQNYSPHLEQTSIDEAFLDMTTTIHLFGTPVDTANKIRKEVYTNLGFTVNVGISSNKILAKMASDFKKPNLCHTLFPEEIQSKMWPLPIQELFFAGAAACKKLNGIGLYTIGDLAGCDLSLLKLHLGNKYAIQIHNYANGIDSSPVTDTKPLHKGYGNSITLSHDVSDLHSARQVLLSLSETVGARLRMDEIQSSCICVEVKDLYFQTHSHQITLNQPTNSTTVIYEYACILLREFWDMTPVRLIGLRATKLTSGYTQLSLFENRQQEKMKKMEEAVDKIRYKFGTDSVKRASFLGTEPLVQHTSGKHLKNKKQKEDQ